MNVNKTKTMAMSRDLTLEVKVEVDVQVLEQVKRFTYLGQTSKLPVILNGLGMEMAKMQTASSVIEPASWEQQFTFIATSDAI